MLKQHVFKIFFISWVVLITLLSLFSFSGLDGMSGIRIPYADKMIHFVFYFVFVVLGFFSFGEGFPSSFKPLKRMFIWVVIAALYGILMELLQYLMSYGRAAEFLDVLANCTGAVFGGLLIKRYLSLTKKLK